MPGFNQIQFIDKLGRVVLNFFAAAGRLGLFAFEAVLQCFKRPFYGKAFARQLIEIGFYSLPVVALTTLFSGTSFRNSGVEFSAAAEKTAPANSITVSKNFFISCAFPYFVWLFYISRGSSLRMISPVSSDNSAAKQSFIV